MLKTLSAWRAFFSAAMALLSISTAGAQVQLAGPDIQGDAPEEFDGYPPPENGGFEDFELAPPQVRTASLTQLDCIMRSAIEQYAVPGATLAVAKNGKLVYAKGFGIANLQTGERVTPQTLFNLASVTKTVSTLGILTLCDAGKLNLDAPLYDVIGRPQLPNRPDPRMYQVTIRQLLHHSAGWNDDGAYARVNRRLRQMEKNGGGRIPYSQGITVLLATPLDYAPGTDAKYANGDWNIIKYVIECASGERYGMFMRQVLARIGITDMRDEHNQYFPGEAARYRGRPPRQLSPGVSQVPLQPEFGNWLASSVDMVMFMTALDGTRCPPPISPGAYDAMLAPLPPPMVNRQNGSHYGLGLDAVKVSPSGVFYTKNGGKPGVHTQIEHLPNGVDYAVMFNGGANESGAVANPLNTVLPQIRGTLTNVVDWNAQPIDFGSAPR